MKELAKDSTWSRMVILGDQESRTCWQDSDTYIEKLEYWPTSKQSFIKQLFFPCCYIASTNGDLKCHSPFWERFSMTIWCFYSWFQIDTYNLKSIMATFWHFKLQIGPTKWILKLTPGDSPSVLPIPWRMAIEPNSNKGEFLATLIN